ncbi:MAG: sugar phosphate isomerase/epimerase family protein [Planctomycetota bacterium]
MSGDTMSEARALLACGTLSYRQESLGRALAGIAAAGFPGVEIGCVCGYCEHVVPEQMTPGEMDALAEQAREHDLRIASIAGHVDLEYPLLGKGAETAAEGFRKLRARIDLAAHLGVPIVNTGVGVAADDEDMDAFFDEFRGLLDHAAENDVRIGVESHAGVSETAAASLAFCREVGHPALGINHDAGNVRFYAGQDPVADLESVADEIGEWLVHVHIKDHRGGQGDWDFPPLGEGELDLYALAGLYRRIGFAGPYSLEIEFSGPDSTDPTPGIIDRGVADSYQFMKNLGLEDIR